MDIKTPNCRFILDFIFVELISQATKGKSILEVIEISSNALLSFLLIWSIVCIFMLVLLRKENIPTNTNRGDLLVGSLIEELKDHIVSLVSNKGFSTINELLIKTTLNEKQISVYNGNFREALKDFASKFVKEWRELKFPIDDLSIYKVERKYTIMMNLRIKNFQSAACERAIV